MATARNRGARARNISLNIWLSSSEKAALAERAGTQPVSTWLRELALGQPTGASNAARRNRVALMDAILAPLLLAVAKVGNNLNQIARQVNTDNVASRSMDVVEIRFALTAIRARLRSIEEEVRRACESLSARSS